MHDVGILRVWSLHSSRHGNVVYMGMMVWFIKTIRIMMMIIHLSIDFRYFLVKIGFIDTRAQGGKNQMSFMIRQVRALEKRLGSASYSSRSWSELGPSSSEESS